MIIIKNQKLLYICVGVINTLFSNLLNVFIINIFGKYLNIYSFTLIIFILTNTFSYLTQTKFTFKNSFKLKKLIRYALINLTLLVIFYIGSSKIIHILINEKYTIVVVDTIFSLMLTAIGVIINYIYIFKRAIDE